MIEFPEEYMTELEEAITDSDLPTAPKIFANTLLTSLVLLKAYCRDHGSTIHQVNLADFLEEFDGFTYPIPKPFVCSIREIETRQNKELARERIKAGQEEARAKGRVIGKQKSLTAEQIDIGKALAADKTRPVMEICKHLNISRPTFYRYIAPKA